MKMIKDFIQITDKSGEVEMRLFTPRRITINRRAAEGKKLRIELFG
jgi:hypothetical protein